MIFPPGIHFMKIALNAKNNYLKCFIHDLHLQSLYIFKPLILVVQNEFFRCYTIISQDKRSFFDVAVICDCVLNWLLSVTVF